MKMKRDFFAGAASASLGFGLLGILAHYTSAGLGALEFSIVGFFQGAWCFVVSERAARKAITIELRRAA